MARVEITVETDAPFYKVWIDKQALRLVDGKGGRDLGAGPHMLAWLILDDKEAKGTITAGGEWTTNPTPIPVKADNKAHYAAGAASLIRKTEAG
jgi:hypothetical protein